MYEIKYGWTFHLIGLLNKIFEGQIMKANYLGVEKLTHLRNKKFLYLSKKFADIWTFL